MWMMWRPNNLRHYKQLPRMWWYWPRPVFISAHQASEYSRALGGALRAVPYLQSDP
jgi:hypothetical protein